ncbi:MAG: membrane protein YdbS with pleckstrin-like domain [Candidatus Endobugula sp.]|jgi:membrane protein YdbS with pleckstrin-like domain
MTLHFENLSVDPNELPGLSDFEFKSVDPRYLKVSLISSTLFFLVLIIGATAAIYFSEFEDKFLVYLISSSSIAILLGLNVLVIILGFKKKKYALRQRDVIYTKGLIWSTRTTVPFIRIQHAELKQGPIERLFKLNSLKIFTAGGQSSDLVIPGLPEETALNIKDFILKKTAEDGKSES